jgi:deferrochelatase/peroxidase EfeB
MSRPTEGGRISRRALFGVAGAGALTAVGGFAAGRASALEAEPTGPTDVIAFRAAHQAGIATPVQERLHVVAFDLTTDDPRAVASLLQRWTDAADRMTRGLEVAAGGAVDGPAEAPPLDTGEALGLAAARLTLTVGFGPSLFSRLGLDHRRPAALEPLPRFAGDALDPRRSDGDLVVQACADDPQVAVHAVRNLVRLGFGTVQVRWSQLGFGRTSSTSTDEQTPRNLFGFKDGTANVTGDDTQALDEHVWVQPGDGPEWMVGGSYLVARRIRMQIETWDRTSLEEQERITGRTKGVGAPIGQVAEHDPVDLTRLDPHAHVRLAHPDSNGGARLLRRGYSFVDGGDDLGRLDAGLFFLAYQRDPRHQFVPIQQRLAAADGLNEYLLHTGSGVWACPPGVGAGGWWGQSLFTAG